ncbi:MAG: M20/M25/M40 family metallo-hydrolase [Solirubrobacterales bacterium]|nr:M20/M25/M40 family metallo-hydrolase [Solirubrobacterales bacterium]
MSRFVRLCETASPTGEERRVADLVRAELESFGFTVDEDDAAGPAGAGAGNLLCRIPGRSPGWVMFCAHLDTVPHEGPIEVTLDGDGIYRSVGDTILGADNKAAVSVLLELAARHADEPPAIGIELLLTVAEEQGLLGAVAFDQNRLKARIGYVIDHASPVGEVIVAAPTHMRIRATFQGVEAHAGVRPEDGRSAIAAAADAISSMDLGRLDEETTANVGLISGGSSGNVVPGICRIEAEARSVNHERALALIAEMGDRMTLAASEAGCEVDLVTERVFPGYRIPGESAALEVAESALRALEIPASRVATGGGSDANVFIDRGMDCLLLADGSSDNHTSSEAVARDDLFRMLAICEEIVERAAEREAAC